MRLSEDAKCKDDKEHNIYAESGIDLEKELVGTARCVNCHKHVIVVEKVNDIEIGKDIGEKEGIVWPHLKSTKNIIVGKGGEKV